MSSPIMTVMINAARKAVRALRRDFGEIENLQVSRKGPGDFVTNDFVDPSIGVEG